MSTAAIILAGGGSTRFGGNTPKQFIDLLGRPVIAYTLDAFESSASIEEVVVVCHPEWLEFTRSIAKRFAHAKFVDAIPGADTRQGSSLAGLRFFAARGAQRVLVHDSVRPLVPPSVIDEAARRIDETGVVDVVAKTTDTIVRSVEGTIREIPDRSALYNGQTPQGFLTKIALEAHERALRDGITNASDDVQLALRIGYRAVIVDGGAQNIKITHAEDLEVVQLFLERKIGTSRVLRLTRPFVFEELEVPRFPVGRQVSVRMLLGSICAADLRYYSGKRRPEALAQKLPMALLHEGVGEVAYSPVPSIPRGARVVVCPHVQRCDDPACPVCADERAGANYCPANAFRSSGEDGFAQTMIDVLPEQLALIPDEVPTRTALMTEILSIATGALRRIEVEPRHRVCVVGNGPVGYSAKIVAEEALQRDVPLIGSADAVPTAEVYFEAVGGTAQSVALNAIIDAAAPGAMIVLLGVSEAHVPINTRDVLQKGIRLIGCSRSTPVDMARALHYLRRPSLREKVERLMLDRTFRRSEISDAFDFALRKNAWGKVVIDLGTA